MLRRIALMVASNPAAEDVDLVLYSLANVSRQLARGTPLSPPHSPRKLIMFVLVNSADTYVQDAHRTMREHQPAHQLVGMTGSYPASPSTTSYSTRIP